MSRRRTHADWWGYVLKSLRKYPAIHAELEAARTTSMTAAYSGMPGGGGASDPVYAAILRMGDLTKDEVSMHDAIEQAIFQTRQKKNADEVLSMVSMVYFRQTHTIAGAALAVNYSYQRTVELLDEFIHRVAKNRGLE